MEKTGRIEDQNGGVAPIQATTASYNKQLLLVLIGAILPGIVGHLPDQCTRRGRE